MTTHPPFLSMGFWSLEWIRFLCFSRRVGNCQDRASCWYPCRHFIFSNTTRCWTRPSKNNSRANYILSKYTATLKALRLLSQSFTTTHSPSWSLRSDKTRTTHTTRPTLSSTILEFLSNTFIKCEQFNAVNYFYVSWLAQ